MARLGAMNCAPTGGFGYARPPMVDEYGSDVRTNAADCYANSSYGFNRQSRRGDS